MTTSFVLVSILEVIAVALVITGFVFEKKIISFEERCEDRLARRVAHFLCTSRLTRAAFAKEGDSSQQRAQSREDSSPDTSTPTPSRKRSSRVA